MGIVFGLRLKLEGRAAQEAFDFAAAGNGIGTGGARGLERGGGGGEAQAFLDGQAAREGGGVRAMENVAAAGGVDGLDREGGQAARAGGIGCGEVPDALGAARDGGELAVWIPERLEDR